MQPEPTPKKTFDIFLIGDTGSIARHKPDAVLETMKAHLKPETESAVIFLGDNIYPKGLPASGHLLRKEAEGTLEAYKEALKDYSGKVLYISGNHDWNKGRKDGYDYVLRQEKYLENLFGKNTMLPANGCPGPAVVQLNEQVCLVLINTQWWLQPGFRPIGKQYGCGVSSEEEFFEQLQNVLNENHNKRIVVCGHAPVYSYAIHGGRYKFRHHLFPFTIYNKRAYVPLPFIGSLLPLYRRFFGAREDIAHPRYRRLRKRLKEIFKKYKDLIYAAGHEHNLQHISRDSNHFIISGAGSKLKYVLQDGKNLMFGLKKKGFFKLTCHAGGKIYASAWIVDSHDESGKLVYETEL